MKPSTIAAGVIALAVTTFAAGCGDSSGGPAPLTLVPLPAYDGGADAGCTISSAGVRVQCDTAYRITGDPHACPGFDATGSGTTAACQAACMSGLVCTLSGVSDGTSAVACAAGCASPEH